MEKNQDRKQTKKLRIMSFKNKKKINYVQYNLTKSNICKRRAK